MKLSEIDPIGLARTSVNKLRDHVARITFHLAPICQWHEQNSGDGMENTDVGMTIMQLAQYAKSGALGDWPDATCAVDAATQLPPHPGGVADGLAKSPEPSLVDAVLLAVLLDVVENVHHVVDGGGQLGDHRVLSHGRTPRLTL